MLLWLPQDASIKLQNIHHMSRRKAKLEAKESRGRETSSHPDGMEKSHLAIPFDFFLKTPYEFNPNHGRTNGTLDPASMEFYSAWICRGALVLEGKDYWNMCLLFNCTTLSSLQAPAPWLDRWSTCNFTFTAVTTIEKRGGLRRDETEDAWYLSAKDTLKINNNASENINTCGCGTYISY